MNFNKFMVKCEWTFNEGNQIHNFMSSSGSGTVINYGSGSDFLTSYGSGYGSGSTSQKVTVPTVPVPVPVPVPQHWFYLHMKQCCGSGMIIPDPKFFHSGSWIKGFTDPGSRSASASKNLSILTQKNVSKLSVIWSKMFIPDPDLDFLPVPDPESATLLKSRLHVP